MRSLVIFLLVSMLSSVDLLCAETLTQAKGSLHEEAVIRRKIILEEAKVKREALTRGALAGIVGRVEREELMKSILTPPSEGEREARRLYDECYGAFVSGRFREAINCFSGHLREFKETPLWDKGLFMLGNAYMAVGDFEGAEKVFRRVCELSASSMVSEAMLKLGLICVKKSGIKRCKMRLEALSGRYPYTMGGVMAIRYLEGNPWRR